MGFPILVRRHLYIESGPRWNVNELMDLSKVGPLSTCPDEMSMNSWTYPKWGHYQHVQMKCQWTHGLIQSGAIINISWWNVNELMDLSKVGPLSTCPDEMSMNSWTYPKWGHYQHVQMKCQWTHGLIQSGAIINISWWNVNELMDLSKVGSLSICPNEMPVNMNFSQIMF